MSDYWLPGDILDDDDYDNEGIADDADDGYEEFECFWPALDGPDGRDMFDQYPVSGEPSQLIDDKRISV